MRATFAFSSGMYRTWERSRHVGVTGNKECKKVLVPGLNNAIRNGTITDTEVTIDDQSFKGFVHDGDRIILPKPLRKGNYTLRIKFTYSDLDPAVLAATCATPDWRLRRPRKP